MHCSQNPFGYQLVWNALASQNTMKAKYWVSITGLELKSIWRYPQFWLHAVPSMTQARAAKGNISAAACSVDGLEHTLTIWETRHDMLAYLRQGAHLEAMKASRSIGKYGKVHGYETEDVPDATWESALKRWKTEGRVVLGQPKPGDKGYVVATTEQPLENC